MKIREVMQNDGRVCRVAVPETPHDVIVGAAYSQAELAPYDQPGLTAATAATGSSAPVTRVKNSSGGGML